MIDRVIRDKWRPFILLSSPPDNPISCTLSYKRNSINRYRGTKMVEIIDNKSSYQADFYFSVSWSMSNKRENWTLNEDNFF